MADTSAPSERADSRENLALGLARVSLVLYVVAMAVAGDDDSSYGFLWPVTGILGGVAAFMGWRAGAPRPRGKALAATVIGALVFLVILGWIVIAAITGDL